ncbi:MULTISPECIES: glucokinase [Pseudomonas]|uniref:Glucokinase n=1 Tax=Pseudomonas gingeri TaxID=117681 RepID=A0A7Y7WTW6_9PSED|nr:MULTISPECIES: glucokinase [Pseudomonas]MPQ70309.1 glucokinase [Pseudomonas sp. MWU12-2323]NWB87626.1 glucokinase [Pseudomonas gingeri]RBH56219.1 glucokinase [Pseudomonas sp. MWU13-2860]
MKLALVGDIGGTNARFALWKDNALDEVKVLATVDHSSPEEAIKVYLDGLGLALGSVGAVCLSVAGPVGGDEFRFTNNHWRLSRRAFCETLQVDELLLVNDFSAMALGMTRLEPGDYRVVCEGTPEPLRPAVVIGPGTGLGVGTLLHLGEQHFMALPGEGGHVDLPLSSVRETQLWQHIHSEIGHVSAETALSGGGLPRVYRAICAVDGHVPVLETPESITAAGLAGDPIAREVLEQFSCWLGRVAGNNVLTTGARGGVYIVGGVIPRFADFFINSGFARSFADKGCMSDYFKGIPVWLVTAPYSGLIGAGVALQQAFAH